MRPSPGHLAACAAACVLAVTGCSGSENPSAPADTGAQTNAGPTTESVTAAPSETGEETGGATSATAAPELALPEPPGELVDVDGHLMHLYCTGEGDPTVLFEAGAGDVSVNFWRVQEELSATTRVCTYDRAGLGWSEPTPGPRTGEQMVEELEALLEGADEPGPYVLAGHSLGGLVVLLFAEENPDDVAGVVLIDSSHPAQEEEFAASLPELEAAEEAGRAQREALAARAEAGNLGPSDLFTFTPRGLPIKVREQMAALQLQPHTWRTLLAEDDAFPQTLSQVGDAGSLGDVPLIVLAAGLGLEEQMSALDRRRFGITSDDAERFDATWRTLQEDHLARSTNSRLVVAENSTHSVYFDEREVVIEAIQSLVER